MTQTEIVENLRALTVLAQINFQAKQFVSLNCISAFILQRIGADLVQNADATPFLLLINDGSEALFLNQLHSLMQLPAAITFGRGEYVTSQTLRVNSHESRHIRPQLSFEQHYKFFVAP